MMNPSRFTKSAKSAAARAAATTSRAAALLLLGACTSLSLSACASFSTLDEDSTRLRMQADTFSLRQATRQALHRAGVSIRHDRDNPDLPLLRLSEEQGRQVLSLGADGSVSSYQLSYTLVYQYDDKPQEKIRRSSVINHDENLYRAGKNQQRQIIDSLRDSALSQMIISLQLH